MTTDNACVDCGERHLIHGRGLCRRCYARRARRLSPVKRCEVCGQDKTGVQAGVCRACYQRVRGRPERVCRGCGEVAPHQGHGLCSRCYRRQWSAPERECDECGEHLPHHGKGLCATCHDRRRRGLVATCDQCGETRLDAGNGRCARCTREHGRRPRPPASCSSCGQEGRLHGHGLCERCYRRTQPRKQVVCAGCGRTARHAAMGLCERCYRQVQGPRRGTCEACGADRPNLQHGLCHACFYATELPLLASRSTLGERGQPWAGDLLVRFHRALVRWGYSGFQAARYSTELGRRLVANEPGSRAAFCTDEAQRLNLHLATQGPLRGLDARLARFLVEARLAGGVDLSVSGFRGRAVAIIAAAPEALRPELALMHEALLGERDYRRRTGEHAPSERSIHRVVAELAGWAGWMAGQGLTSWQQLTPDRFRQRMADLGVVGDNGVVRGHLGLLRQLLRELKARRRIFSNPLAGLRAPRAPDVRQRPLEDGELAEWIRRFSDVGTDPVLRLAGLLAVLHGLSQSELCAVQLRDLDRRQRTLRLVRRGLTIQLDPLTLDAVAAYLAVRPEPTGNRHLFVTTHTRLGLTPASSGFIDARFRSVGLQTRALRQHLIRELVAEDGSLIAARYFGMSVEQVSRHMCHQAVVIRESHQAVTDCIQDSL